MGIMGAGLTNNEIDQMELIIDKVKNDRESEESIEARDEIFLGRKKIARVRYWFDSIPGVPLRDVEIDAIIDRYAEPDVVRTILNTQTRLTTEQAISLVEAVSIDKWYDIAPTIISSSKISDDTIKLKAFDIILERPDWGKFMGLMNVMDREILSSELSIWTILFDKIIAEINSGSKAGEIFAGIIAEEDLYYVDIYSKNVGIESEILYDRTGKEQYLPQSAKDIFLF